MDFSCALDGSRESVKCQVKSTEKHEHQCGEQILSKQINAEVATTNLYCFMYIRYEDKEMELSRIQESAHQFHCFGSESANFLKLKQYRQKVMCKGLFSIPLSIWSFLRSPGQPSSCPTIYIFFVMCYMRWLGSLSSRETLWSTVMYCIKACFE